MICYKSWTSPAIGCANGICFSGNLVKCHGFNIDDLWPLDPCSSWFTGPSNYRYIFYRPYSIPIVYSYCSSKRTCLGDIRYKSIDSLYIYIPGPAIHKKNRQASPSWKRQLSTSLPWRADLADIWRSRPAGTLNGA